MTATTSAPVMTEAEGLAYLAPRPRYTSARIKAAARAIGSRMLRLDDAGSYGWNLWLPGGCYSPCQTLADVAAALLRDHAAAARARAVKAAAAAPAPHPCSAEAVADDALQALVELSEAQEDLALALAWEDLAPEDLRAAQEDLALALAWETAPAAPAAAAPALESSADVIRQDGAVPILGFHPACHDGPYVAGDGIDLWSFSSEDAALRYCQALRREGAEPVALAENALGQWRPILPGEAVAPAAPAPAGPGPELPAFITCQQQQQQPQQGGQWRHPARGGRVAWDEPGESAADVAAHNAALARKAAAPAPAAPAPVVAPGPLARSVAPARLPADVAALLQRFGLSIKGVLTVGGRNAKLAKGADLAWPVILHHLPARSLAAAIAGPEAGPTAPRSRIPGLQALAEREHVLALALAHNGCPWASAGCAAGCLAWAGHGGLSVTVAAARARRTLAMLAGGPVYARAVLWAIARAYRQAQAKGLPLAVRLRGTDDSPWHAQRFSVSPAEAQALARRYGLPVAPGHGLTLPEALALAPAGTIRLYDYSKAPLSGPQGLKAQRAAGFDVTASLAADRQHGLAAALQAVAEGFRLAVPVALPKGAALPPVLLLRRSPGAPIWRLRTIDGDLTDHRWADPAGPQPARPGVTEAPFDGVAVLLRTKRSRGRGPEADAFSLWPVWDRWQPLAGGGQACLTVADPTAPLPA